MCGRVLPAGGNLTVTYHTTDLVDTISHGGRTTDYTLDVGGERIRTWTDNATGSTVQRRHHYANDSDSPAWTQGNATDWTRTITGLDDMTGTLTSGTGATTWQLANLHGDLIASTGSGDAGLSATHETTEYGRTRNPADTGTRRTAGSAPNNALTGITDPPPYQTDPVSFSGDRGGQRSGPATLPEPYAAASGTYGSEGAAAQQCAAATRQHPRRDGWA